MVMGCSAMQLEEVALPQPALRIEEYFQGQTWAWGLFEDRFGKVRRQFQVLIEGQYQQGQLHLDEHFIYNDGETQQRSWMLQPQVKGRYQGQAADVIGEAKGQVSGNAFNWHYEMWLPLGEGQYRVRFNDWMYLQPGLVLINTARVRKWGVELGRVTLFFTKHAPADRHTWLDYRPSNHAKQGWGGND